MWTGVLNWIHHLTAIFLLTLHFTTDLNVEGCPSFFSPVGRICYENSVSFSQTAYVSTRDIPTSRTQCTCNITSNGEEIKLEISLRPSTSNFTNCQYSQPNIRLFPSIGVTTGFTECNQIQQSVQFVVSSNRSLLLQYDRLETVDTGMCLMYTVKLGTGSVVIRCEGSPLPNTTTVAILSSPTHNFTILSSTILSTLTQNSFSNPSSPSTMTSDSDTTKSSGYRTTTGIVTNTRDIHVSGVTSAETQVTTGVVATKNANEPITTGSIQITTVSESEPTDMSNSEKAGLIVGIIVGVIIILIIILVIGTRRRRKKKGRLTTKHDGSKSVSDSPVLAFTNHVFQVAGDEMTERGNRGNASSADSSDKTPLANQNRVSVVPDGLYAVPNKHKTSKFDNTAAKY